VGRLPERPVLAADYCELTKIVGIKRRAEEMKNREVETARKCLVCVYLRAERSKRAGDCSSCSLLVLSLTKDSHGGQV